MYANGLLHGAVHRARRLRADDQPLLHQLRHQLAEALPLSSPSRFDTGTRTSVNDSSEVSAPCWPTLSSTRPDREPRAIAQIDDQQRDTPWRRPSDRS